MNAIDECIDYRVSYSAKGSKREMGICKQQSEIVKRHYPRFQNIIFFFYFSYGSYKKYLSDPAGSDLYTTGKRYKTFGKVSAR